jgi:hypothetical protein
MSPENRHIVEADAFKRAEGNTTAQQASRAQSLTGVEEQGT